MRFVVLILVLFLVVACSQGTQPSEPASEVDNRDSLQQECDAQGGELIGCETLTGFACSLPTSDGGKSCTDSNECEKECVAPPGCEMGMEAEGTCADRTHLVCSGVRRLTNGVCEPLMVT